jgi:hypothetical protein
MEKKSEQLINEVEDVLDVLDDTELKHFGRLTCCARCDKSPAYHILHWRGVVYPNSNLERKAHHIIYYCLPCRKTIHAISHKLEWEEL